MSKIWSCKLSLAFDFVAHSTGVYLGREGINSLAFGREAVEVARIIFLHQAVVVQ